MGNLMLRADYQQDIRAARSDAALAMRKYDRELGGYKFIDLIGQVGCAIHIVETIRLAPATMKSAERSRLLDHLLRKMSSVEMGVTRLCNTDPAPIENN